MISRELLCASWDAKPLGRKYTIWGQMPCRAWKRLEMPGRNKIVVTAEYGRNMDEMGEGGFNGYIICSPRPALLPYSTLRPAVHLLPCHYPSDALSVPKIPHCQCFLPRREPRRSWPDPEAVPPALSYRDIPFCGKHLHLTVHHNRPITVSSLDRWRRREKLSSEGVPIAQRGGGLASPRIPLYPPESARSRVRQPIDA